MSRYRADDWVSPDVEIRPSKIHGKGMFALRPIAQDEVVAIWGGAFVDRSTAEHARSAGKIVQRLEEDLFEIVDRSNPGPSYYQNHSCDPNTGMNDEVTVVALRAIRPDEELTLDYATFELNEEWVMPWECRCGAPLCRKTITGRDWKLAHLQERYGSHFSPVLLRRKAGGGQMPDNPESPSRTLDVLRSSVRAFVQCIEALPRGLVAR